MLQELGPSYLDGWGGATGGQFLNHFLFLLGGRSHLQGAHAGLLFSLSPSANTLEVTRGVEEALKELQPGLAGLEMDTRVFRPATFIESSINNLTRALVIGSVLVVVVLVAFLYSWRSALISAVA